MFQQAGTGSSQTGLTGVPQVPTCGPGQRAFKGVTQVEDGPGQHQDVGDGHIGQDHLGRHPYACRVQ